MGMRWSFSVMTRTPLLYMFSTMSISNVTNKLLKVEPKEFCFQDCLSLLQTLGGDFKALGYGNSVHCLCIKTGFASDVFVQNNVMRFYAGHGDLERACQLFDEIPEPNLVSWTTMISSHVHSGRYEASLSIFNLMLCSGSSPNEFAFSLALKACKITRRFFTGLLIHGLILKSGFDSDTFCSSAILGIYLEYGDVEDAFKFFNGIPSEERSEASWNTLIDTFVQMSKTREAVEWYKKMRASGVSPNCFTYSILLKLCSNMLIAQLGWSIHGQIVKLGFEDDVIVGSALVDVYAKLGLVNDSCHLFQSLKEKDNIVWCALLSGLHQIGDANRGLTFYSEFLTEGNKPDPFTFSVAFSLCSTLEAEYIGTKTHCSLVKHGFVIDSILGSSLINMYHNLGMVLDAYECFLEVRSKDDSCFSAMINALVSSSNNEKALELFLGMRKLGFPPSQSTISCILRSLANLDMIKQGKTFHSCILKTQYGDAESKLSTENALIEMYGKCGPIASAEVVFKGMKVRNEYSWTTLMVGFGQFGKFKQVLGLFRNMLICSQLEKPSRFTVVTVLQACAKLRASSLGRQVHSIAIKSGFSSHPFVGSSLVAMYSTCRSEIRDAFRAFSSIREHDIVSWSAMLTAWVQSGHHEEALKHFFTLRRSTLFFDESVFSTCLSACAGLAATETGKSFHAVVIKVALESNPHVASSIADMYSKCGCVNEARQSFDETKCRNLVTWTAMISGYAYNGLGEESVQLFNEMKDTGLEPDGIAFIGVLSACSHAGLVREGRGFFESMKSDHGLEVTVNHYACMVDLFGRNEQVEAAESLIKDAPFQPASKYLLWRALLGACNTHGNVGVGNRIAQKMLELRPREPSTYVLLSNIYASASMWDDSIGVRSKMKEANIAKQPGSSWIQLAS